MSTPSALQDAALVLIDVQNTYRRGELQLENVEPAVVEAQRLLALARSHGVPVFHVRHDGGAGSPYDLGAIVGQISTEVAPIDGEAVITKEFPNSFWQTDLDARLKALGVQKLVLAGFVTHMCITATSHGAVNRGYTPTVVASTTATRALDAGHGREVPAAQVHESALAAIRDLGVTIVDRVDDLSA